MAVRSPLHFRRQESTPPWPAVSIETELGIPIDVVRRMLRDVASWPLWDPEVARVEHLEGKPGEAGSTYRLAIGSRRWSIPVIAMLVAAQEDQIVLAGGGPQWYFVEQISLTPLNDESTLVERRLELDLCRLPKWLTGPARRLAQHRVTRSLQGLT